MINQLLLICTAIIIYELFKFVKFKEKIISNLRVYKKIFKIFKLQKVSDFRKEKLFFSYSKILFFLSIKILLIFLFILVIILIMNLLSNTYVNLIKSTLGIIELSIVFIIYHLFRRKINAEL